MKYPSVFYSVVLAPVVMLFLLLAFTPVHVLEIAYSCKIPTLRKGETRSSVGSEAKRDGRVFWTRVEPGHRFSLEYTHSVQLCRVVDDFEIDRRYQIYLVSTSFSDHGAGLPYSLNEGETFSVQDDGGFRISGMRIFLPEILLRVQREYDNIFVFGFRRINLSEKYGDVLFAVRTKRCAIFKYLLWRLLNVG